MRPLLRQKSPASRTEKLIGCRFHSSKQNHETNTMKPTLKTTLAALSFAILAALAFSGCASTGGGSANRTHEMGPPKSPSRMLDRDMPGR